MTKFLKETFPKITQDYILEKASDPEAHYGVCPDANLKFNLVKCLGTIANREAYAQYIRDEIEIKQRVTNSDRKFIADRFWVHQLYANAKNPYHYWLWHSPKDESQKRIPRQKHWSENRHHAVFSEKLSFLCQEGDQLHLGMQYGLGHDWAEKFPAKQFIKCTLKDFIISGTKDGLFLPWDHIDPVLSFQLLSEQHDKNDMVRKLRIEPVSSIRPSTKRAGEQKNIVLARAENSLLRGSKFQLQMTGFDFEEAHLVIEYSEELFSVNGSAEIYCGEIMPYQRHVENRMIFEGENKTPFEVNQPAGKYGFIVISGYDVRQLQIEAGLSEGEEFLDQHQMQMLAKRFRDMSHLRDADISLTTVSYSVID